MIRFQTFWRKLFKDFQKNSRGFVSSTSGSGEERSTVLGAGHDGVEHTKALREDASDGPDIDLAGVVFLKEDKFGSAIPASDNVRSHRTLERLGVRHDDHGARSVGLVAGGVSEITGAEENGGTDSTGETEIANFHGTILVDEAIRGLEIAMVDTGRMEVTGTDRDIVHQRLDMQFGEEDGRAEEFFEIGIANLKNDVELVEAFQIFGDDDVVKLDKENVGDAAQDSHLTKDTLAIDQVVKHTVHALDGDHLAAARVTRLAHLSVGTCFQIE